MTSASKTSHDGNRGKLQQDQEFRILLVPESSNGIRVFSKHNFDVRGRAVPASNPHHTRNRTGDLAALLKVRVLDHYGKAVHQRKPPHSIIRRAVKPYRLDVR